MTYYMTGQCTERHNTYFAAVSLSIHVEFLNDERGKEKER